MRRQLRDREPAPAHVAGFVGRERELASVVDALRGRAAVVLVEGEAGIGKSRLVHEALLAAPLADATVLRCASPPVATPFPLGPVLDGLRGWTVAGVRLSPLVGALRPLLPEWAEHLPDAPEPLPDPIATRHRVLRALTEVIERLGVDVMVVEDAHWADASTLELLLMLAASPPPDLRVIVTYRSEEVPADSLLPRLTARSSVHPRQVRVSLGPLSVDETGRLVASVFNVRNISPAFVTFLHERTDGIPLAVEESLSLLRERGDITWHGDRWSRRAVEDLHVPPTVRDSVLERVGRLPPTALLILRASAILAAPADEKVLGRVAGLSPDAASRGLARGLEVGLLHESAPDSFEFRHVLASLAVEEAVPVSDRRRMHRRAANVVAESDPAPLVRLCRHYREANDIARWATHAEVAAELTLQSGDDRAAVEILLDLLAAADHPRERRVRIARALGRMAAWGVASLADLGGRVIDALRSALSHGSASPEHRGELRVLLGRLLLQLGEFEEAARQTEAAVADLVGRPDLAAPAMISLAWPRGPTWPAARHLEWLNRASSMFPAISDADRMWLDVDRASILLMLGDERGWEAATSTVARAQSLPERRQAARCLMNVGHAAIAWGRDTEARRHLDEAIALMQSTGYERLLSSARLTAAYLDWHGGQWDGLAQRVAAIVDGEDILPEAWLEARYTRAVLTLAAGDRASAEQELRTILAELSRRGLVDALMAPAAALGRLGLADGDPDEALESTTPAINVLMAKGLWWWVGEVAPVHVQALVDTGNQAAARRVVERLVTGLGDRDAPAPRAALRACHGILAGASNDAGDAAGHLVAAAEAWSALPRPYDELLTMERLGRIQLRAGLVEEARLTLTRTQQRLHDLGARWDADRVARLLRQHGVDVARVWRGGRRGYGDKLSPREREVARLVSQGLTNRQVAKALFLSPRTIDRHLSAVMRKLGVGSRTAVAVAVAVAVAGHGPADVASAHPRKIG